MRTWISIAVVLGLVAACGKGGDEGGGGKRGKGKPKPLTVAEVVTGTTKPALLGPYAAAKLGMTEDELKAAVPGFAEHGEFLSRQDYGLSFYAAFDGTPKRLGDLRIGIPVADAGEIARAWGPGIDVTFRGKPAQLWLDPDAKVRAVLREGTDQDTRSLQIERYLPAKEILGEPGTPLGIEDQRPLIAATPDELAAAYPDHLDRVMATLAFLKWPTDEYGDGAFQLEAGIKDGKVDRLQFWLHHGDNPTAKADRRALAEAKFGPAREVEAPLGKATRLGDSTPAVTIAETTGAWVIEIGWL